MNKWKFIAVFHNLRLESSIKTKYASILRYDDEITQSFCEKSSELSHFINNFTNQFGRKIFPSLFFFKEKIEPNLDTIISFRNSFAISSIVFAWENQLKNFERGQFFPYKYSIYFDLYPYSPSTDFSNLIAYTPSGISIDRVSSFRGQTSPEIIRPSITGEIFYDKVLLDKLLKRWETYYVRKRSRNWSNRALFHSLEMAYLACALPFNNQGNLYDYGSNIALWISAFEILVHPERGEVNLFHVIDAIDRVKFGSIKLNHKRFSYKQKKKFNLIQKTYYEMYETRNKFLHGNRVKMSDLFPNRDKRLPPLIASAPIIYKLMLYQHLDLLQKPNQNDLKEWIQYESRVGNMEEALSNIRKKYG